MIVLEAHLASQLGMGAQMHGFTVNRHKVRGLGHGHQELELLLATVARDVDKSSVLIPHVATELGQAVDDLLDGFLVTGDRRCREDNGIASWMESVLCSPLAMRDRADSGSPCEPVHMTTILSSGRLSISKASRISASSMLR